MSPVNQSRYRQVSPVHARAPQQSTSPHGSLSRSRHHDVEHHYEPQHMAGGIDGSQTPMHMDVDRHARARARRTPGRMSTPLPPAPLHQDTALGASLAEYHNKATERRTRLREGRRRLMSTPPADTVEGKEYRRMSRVHNRDWSRDARRDGRVSPGDFEREDYDHDQGGRDQVQQPPDPEPAKPLRKVRMSTMADKQAKKLGIQFPESMIFMPTSEVNEWIPPNSTMTKGRIIRPAQDAYYYQRQREVQRRRSSRRDVVREEKVWYDDLVNVQMSCDVT
ncbi:hypothetical protein BJ508DRAFT_329702 [Ascobolus immersus RN42]|uniref:Uncharacterized protein n=1 Tax=Ascobolus immersus RN42 TaxID=1160509 RepID=A0A3N4I825_ASCIM|nr:hypothetical protein BJ508DRAFT_329702 [Ascobolus immersus RN42]